MVLQWPASSLSDRIFILLGILWNQHHNEACSGLRHSWVAQDSRSCLILQVTCKVFDVECVGGPSSCSVHLGLFSLHF